MKINEDGMLLRIFIGESDTFHGKPLYEAIVQKARELGMAGATVFRGVEGFGKTSIVHKARLLELSTDLPIVIEIVDRQDRMDAFLPHLDTLITGGLATLEPVKVLVYRHDPKTGPP
jgi:PII-like signaling protein